MSIHILYVEDDSKSRRVMQLLLINRMKLPHVTILEDSQDFLERVLSIDPPPEVIFLDIHVTPLDGFEMLRLLRASKGFDQSKIVALTASVMSEEVVKLREAGFDGCLSKPIDSDIFPQLLERIMQGEQVWAIIQ
ncbi:MAG: response regulator [Anaerolineae bacterium]|nr:response regulator [Anaerolineae bacterium]